jgi:proteic killer suppression protein
MIESFRNKELAKLWEGTRTRIDRRFHSRIEARLDALDAATKAEDMNLPGFDYHQLVGNNPVRYTVHVNGPWCITFEFNNGNAYNVDFEQYH